MSGRLFDAAEHGNPSGDQRAFRSSKSLNAREPMMATNTDWTNGAAEALILFGPFRLLPKQRLLGSSIMAIFPKG